MRGTELKMRLQYTVCLHKGLGLLLGPQSEEVAMKRRLGSRLVLTLTLFLLVFPTTSLWHSGVKAGSEQCSCGGKYCKCAFDACGRNGALSCGCSGVDCDCKSMRCPKFSTTSNCSGFTSCNSDGKRHCNRHACP